MENFSSSDSGIKDDTTHGSRDASPADYLEYNVAIVIWKIAPPCILLLGGFGNIATVFVMRRIKDHNSSQYAILIALAISDFVLLCSTAIDWWIITMFSIHMKALHVASCKFIMWAVYWSNTTSAWLVTCVTVQRTMAVLWPHRIRAMCTVRRTWVIIAALALTACAIDLHFLLGPRQTGCVAVPGAYEYFVYFIFPWVDLSIASFLPSACLFVCDIVLSVALFKAVSSSFLAAPVDSNNTENRRKTSSRTTVMVLTISCAFFVLTTPEYIYFIWTPYIDKAVKKQPQMVATLNLFHAITHQMWSTNSAINFLLYCLTGTKFRREFLNWIRCGGAQSPSAPSVHDTASGVSTGGKHKYHRNSPLSK
ncbi:hypothetical protein ACOMHN_053205 [Nucella lapillus]